MSTTLHRSIWLLIVVAVVYVAGFMVDNGEPGQLWWWPLALAFFVWASLPFLLLGIGANRKRDSVPALSVLLVATLLIAVGGSYLIWDAFVTHLDPQSGVLFVVLPPLQLVVAGLGLGIALLFPSANRP